jgi:catechol 2,3-dioxygenase-like lactoylglutathione lyase family enzyme
MTTCSCCGEAREQVVALECHPEVAVCRDCVGWLFRKLPGTVHATPILRVDDLDVAEKFWAAVGQDVERWEGGGYAFVGSDGEILHLAEEQRSGAGACYLLVDEVGPWHAGWAGAGHEPGPVVDQPWGMREFTVTDPSGNMIRVAELTG